MPAPDQQILNIQKRLNVHGVRDYEGRPLVEDGLYGERSRSAVLAFQARIGVPQDGRLDARQMAALIAAPPPSSGGLKPLFCDVYAQDTDGDKLADWEQLAAKGLPWAGGFVKATQGTSYRLDWLKAVWPMVREAGGDRYGDTWFRGSYAFLNLTQPGVKQADFYLRAIESAGGWGPGDFWPALDVELGNDGKNGKPKGANWAASKHQIIDCVTSAAEHIKARTGRDVILYGNGAMRDKGITNRMGCRYLWLPRYTKVIEREIYERAGWRREDLILWQYNEPGSSVRIGYPKNPGAFMDDSQTSSLEHPGGLPWLRTALAA